MRCAFCVSGGCCRGKDASCWRRSTSRSCGSMPTRSPTILPRPRPRPRCPIIFLQLQSNKITRGRPRLLLSCVPAPSSRAEPPILRCGEHEGRDGDRNGPRPDEHGGAVGRPEGPLRGGRDAAAWPCAGEDACLGDPARAPRRARGRLPARGRGHAAARQPRGAGHGDGGGRELQRRLGGARPADLALRRAWRRLSHRGLRRLGHRLGRRRQGEALEGRRRGRHPLQPGRRRRRALQRRRPDVLAQPADLGLRDAGRILRAVHLRAEPAADAPAAGT